MAKQKFDFKSVEDKWKSFWEKEGIFKTDLKKKISYSIDTPPPTVSGKMHIGHAFSYAQQDFIVRFRRMLAAAKGESVFYPFGTDDNGLPTERLVEKASNVKSKNMSRADFIKLCLKTLKEIKGDFIRGWKNIGMSCDFEKIYSTIDDNSRKISQKSFIELYNKKDIYKKEFPTIWCPECQTSIAQAELEDKERVTELSYIKGKLEDGSYIIYATTRPELHPGCIGISLNEEGIYVRVKRDNGEVWVISKDAVEKMKDEFPMKVLEEFKGKELVGKKVHILFAEQPVFISHDISAKTEYGTGVVYYCSYGGVDCIQWLGRHPEAKAISVMDESGKYIKGPAKGMKSEKAREKILKLLDKEGFLIKREKMSHTVNVHDKCGTPIEFISTEQWFIKILDKKEKWLELGKKINWYPGFMKKRYDNWVNGLEWDWSISRERHFGVPIPVWECKDCREVILASEKELPVDPLQVKKKCPKCKKEATPEDKVLDTWATSSLTPMIASSLFGNKIKIPFSLRPNAHDIIRTWAFYTIVKAYLHEKKIPWEDIVVSGIVSLGGEKMSKSKGNVVNPQEVLEKYGADALRFWAAGSKLGSDLDYQEKDLVAGTKMINKLLNASKFVFMNLEGYDGKKPKKLEPLDELFLNKLNSLIEISTKNFEKYEYSRAKLEVEQFFWSDFCDNYLEIVKKRVYQGKGNEKLSAQYTLYKSLLTILKMIAPIMPFITEEIYQEYFKKTEKDKSIHISGWPKFERKGDFSDFNVLVNDLSIVRQEKSKNSLPLNSPVSEFMTPNYDIISKYKSDFISASGALVVVPAAAVSKGKHSVKFPEAGTKPIKDK